MHASAFRKRSLSAGIVQKTGCCPERREIVARRNGLEEVPELLPQELIRVSSGQGVESPKRQPARALPVGDRDSSAQRRNSVGFSAAIRQLTVDPPQFGLEISLVAAVCQREPLACRGSCFLEFGNHATSSSKKKERVSQVEALPVGARVRHRLHDPLDASG